MAGNEECCFHKWKFRIINIVHKYITQGSVTRIL